MKKEKEITILSGFVGFTIGVCCMMFVNINKEAKQVERFDEIDFFVSENINTCEDIIEWMNEDIKNYADSTVFDTYIWNLEQMIDNNRKLLYSSVDTL